MMDKCLLDYAAPIRLAHTIYKGLYLSKQDVSIDKLSNSLNVLANDNQFVSYYMNYRYLSW